MAKVDLDKIRPHLEDAWNHYQQSGSPKGWIDMLSDLSDEEKKEMYDLLVQRKKGHVSVRNPYEKEEEPAAAEKKDHSASASHQPESKKESEGPSLPRGRS